MYPFSLLTILLLAIPAGATVTAKEPGEITPIAVQICQEIAIELQNAVELGYLTQDAANQVATNCLTSDFTDYTL